MNTTKTQPHYASTTYSNIKEESALLGISQRLLLALDQVSSRPKLHGKKAGIEKRMNPHNFRHSFAHDLLNEGIGLQHIQISLGHSAIVTTSKYLQRFNPRETIETI